MKKISLFGAVAVIFAIAFSFQVNAEEVNCPALKAGDLFKVKNNSAVYYVDQNLNRLYFPNSEIYHSWFDNFSTVVEISSGCVDNYPAPIAPPYGVNYRAGAKLVKVKISPSVYVIEPGNKLRKIKSEEVAKELYGPNWANLVRDVADAFWPNYNERGEDLNEAKPHDGMFVQTPNSSDVYYVENGEMVKVDEKPKKDVRIIGNGVFSKLAVRSGIVEAEKAYERPEQRERNENAATPAVPTDTTSSTPAVPALPSEHASSTSATPAVPAVPANPTTTPTTPAVPATPAVPGGSTTSTTSTTTTDIVCGNSVCENGENYNNCSTDCIDCIDSDGGKDYYVKGETNGYNYTPDGARSSSRIISWDQCSAGVLTERYCDEEDINKSESFNCPYGCGDGACLEQSTIHVDCKDILVINESKKYVYWGWYRFFNAGNNTTYEPIISHAIWSWVDRTIQWASGKTSPSSIRIALFTYNGNENREPFTNPIVNEQDSRVFYRYLITKGYDVDIYTQQSYPALANLGVSYFNDNYDLIWYNNSYGYSSSLATQTSLPIITVSNGHAKEMGLGSQGTMHENLSSVYVKDAAHSISSPADLGSEAISMWTDGINALSGMTVLVSRDNVACGEVGAVVNSNTKLAIDKNNIEWGKTGVIYRLSMSLSLFMKSFFLFIVKAMN